KEKESFMSKGMMGVDWEERIDFDRMRRERLQKAKKVLAESEADVLFVFRTEDARYLTGFRTHMHPSTQLGNATVVLAKGGEPFLFSMDHEHCRARMPWLTPKQIKPRANFREAVGIQLFADMVKEELGDLKGKKIGIDLWTPVMTREFAKAFPNSEIIDGLEILGRAKIIKTKDEIDCIKMANVMTEAAMDAAIHMLKPGVKECEVLATAWEVMTALGSEWTQCANIVASGPYTAPYRRYTSDRVIRMGDPVIIDI